MEQNNKSESILNNMSQRLKTLRKESGLSQLQVAEKLYVTRSAYANYEQGTRQPSTDIIIKLAELYNVSTDYLLGVSQK